MHEKVEPRSVYALLNLLLIVLTLVVFAQTIGHDFITVDDPAYVIDNPQIQAGLTMDTIAWAMTSTTLGHWHPATHLSYMLDMELFGTNPAGFHLTNMLLHMGSVLLLFLILYRLTGSPGRSAFVAALFAIHPLHVESVAWIAERKDVLSTFFAFLALLAYVSWVHRRRRRMYAAMLAAFTIACASKAVVVTIPCLMLLLDYWPLRRDEQDKSKSWKASWWGLVVEKLPLFGVAAACSALAVWADQGAGSHQEGLTFGYRLGTALIAYTSYIKLTLWPWDLAAFYPHWGTALQTWKVVASGLLIVGVTATIFRYGRKHRYLAVGWLWFLGVIVPVSGLFQGVGQAMADRYTYVSLIGLFICMAWGITEWAGNHPARKRICAVAGGLVILVLTGMAWRQAGFWQDTVILYKHSMAITPPNVYTRQVLGNALLFEGRAAEAEPYFRQAVDLHPSHADNTYKLGNALAMQGKGDEARNFLQKALTLDPSHVHAHNVLGTVLLEAGAHEEAAHHFAEATRLVPNNAAPHLNWGIALALAEDYEQAALHIGTALNLNPNWPEAQYNLAAVRVKQGLYAEAAELLRAVLKADAEHADAQGLLTRATAALDTNE